VKPGAGWLGAYVLISGSNYGVYVPDWSVFEQAPFPTRRHEYMWTRKQLEEETRGIVVDAGCGFNPDIHVLPFILANMGFRVFAFDTEDQSRMASHWNIFRYNLSMTNLYVLPPESVDYWLSVSVLEHVTPEVREQTLREAKRLLKPGGHVLLTTDETEPETVNSWLAGAGFQTGPVELLMHEQLSPRVAWAIARKEGT